MSTNILRIIPADPTWTEAIHAAAAAGFADLDVRVPCCRSKTSLNDLDYRGPAVFARFVLEATEPGRRGGWIGTR